MSSSKRHSLRYSTAALFIMLFAACKLQTVYHHFEPTPKNGWEKNDTISFVIGPIAEEGRYAEDVQLRVNGEYPFTALTLLIEQEVALSQEKRVDTLFCSLFNQQGDAEGGGICQYQYNFRLATMELQKDEKLRVTIRHQMKREILPGIIDIGLRLRHEDR